MVKKLPAKQKRFVEEYLIDLNGTQAAIRAGYSEKGAEKQAFRMSGNVRVQEAIQKAQAQRAQRTEISQDFIAKELKRNYEHCSQRLIRLDKTGKPLAVMNAAGEMMQDEHFDIPNSLRLLEMMARHTGFYDADKSGAGVTVIIGEKDVGTL